MFDMCRHKLDIKDMLILWKVEFETWRKNELIFMQAIFRSVKDNQLPQVNSEVSH